MAYAVDDELQARTAAVVTELRKVALLIDEPWRDALDTGLPKTEIPLGEAIQAVLSVLVGPPD